MEHRALVGDKYKFEYPSEPQFNCLLTVVKVTGDGPNDLVFFDDESHSKQKNLVDFKMTRYRTYEHSPGKVPESANGAE